MLNNTNFKFTETKVEKCEDGYEKELSVQTFSKEDIRDMMEEGYKTTTPSYPDSTDPDRTLGNFRTPETYAAYAALSKNLVEKGLLDKSFFEEKVVEVTEGDYDYEVTKVSDILTHMYGLSDISNYLLEKGGWVFSSRKLSEYSGTPDENMLSSFVHIGNDHIVNVAFKVNDKNKLQIRILPLRGRDSLTWYHLDSMLRDKLFATIAFPFQAYLAEAISAGSTHKIEWHLSNTGRLYIGLEEYNRYLIKSKRKQIMCLDYQGRFESPMQSNIGGDEWIDFYDFIQVMVGIKNSSDTGIQGMVKTCMAAVGSPPTVSYWVPSEEKMFPETSDTCDGSSLIVPRLCNGIQHHYTKADHKVVGNEEGQISEFMDPIFAILDSPELEDEISLLSEIETFLEKESEK